MPYERRYFDTIVTTPLIGEGAVTSDKIVDGAIITSKLAPDAVISEKILDGTIRSEDIKDGEIKTPDIEDASITTDKIVDKSVTRDKLAENLLPAVRPFTPPLSTEELSDLVITAEKLANSSVKTIAVKDLNITSDKLGPKSVIKEKIGDGAVDTDQIMGAAIDETKLKNNSVGPGKIRPGAVGEVALAPGAATHTKIGNYAIKDINLDWLAVSEPKTATALLAARHLESYRVRDIDLSEDFRGVEPSNHWRKQLNYDSYIVTTEKGLKFVSPSAAVGWPCIMDYGGKGIVGHGGKLLLTFVIAESGDPLTSQARQLGLVRVSDKDAYIYFYQDTNQPTPTWYALCKDDVGVTIVDTEIPLSLGPQILGIEWNSPTNVRFYIDGIQVAEITSNIPNTSILDPFVLMLSRTGALRDFTLGMMSLQRLREI